MELKRLVMLAVASVLWCRGADGRPQLVVTDRTMTEPSAGLNDELDKPVHKAFIDSLRIRSDIQFRYSKTQIVSLVKNPANRSQLVEFEVMLPEKAAISNFTIESQGKTYVAEVKEKGEAQEVFDEARNSGNSAGLVDARDGSVFSVQANVAAAEKLVFTLTYEEFLERHLSRYQQTIHVDPKQVVNDLRIDVNINETLPIVDVTVPEIRQSSNEIVELLEPNSVAVVKGANTSRVHVSYHPTAMEQRRINAEKGVTGQFIVQYDVDRKGAENEVQVIDGYFVHFFTPEDLPVMRKHAVFVLDVSGSMGGTKMAQLKDSMVTILDDLKDDDFFTILSFSDGVRRWLPVTSRQEEEELPILKATRQLRHEAIGHVLEMRAVGGTNIFDALSKAVDVAKQPVDADEEVTPLVIFLTDGQPSAGPSTSVTDIREHMKSINGENGTVPIYGLAFGDGADFNFIKGISEESHAFARKIYEGADAAIQLEDFYKEVASPLLTNVTFNYVGESFTDRATNVLPGTIFNRGSECVTVGRFAENEDSVPEIVIQAGGAIGPYETILRPCPRPLPALDVQFARPLPALDVQFTRPIDGCLPPPPAHPTPKSKSANFVRRLWAKMTIDQLLEPKNEPSSKEEEEARKKKALSLALEYNFVTDLTSLVVVKPFEKGAAEQQKELVVTMTKVGSGGYHNTNQGPMLAYYPVNGMAAAHPPTFRLPQSFQLNRVGGVRRSPSFTGNSNRYQTRGPVGPQMTTTTTTTTPCPPVNTCQLVLHSKTYLRGNKTIVNESKEEFLDSLGSSATSLEVIGPCSWTLFSGPKFAGESKEFHENKYESAVSMGRLFRNIKSIKRNHCSS